MKQLMFLVRRNPIVVPALLVILFWVFAAFAGPSLMRVTYSDRKSVV